jgi:hypothetical protein
MIASPCRDCDNRHLPKNLCIRNCAKIAAMQQLQNTLHTPPYACDEGSDRLPYGPESCLTPVPGARR